MVNCWVEDAKQRLTFTAIVQKIDPWLTSLAGYSDLNETILQVRTELLAPESEGVSESSVNAEAIGDAAVTTEAVVESANKNVSHTVIEIHKSESPNEGVYEERSVNIGAVCEDPVNDESIAVIKEAASKDISDTDTKTPDPEIVHEESSVNIEVVGHAPVTNEAIVAVKEISAVDEASLTVNVFPDNNETYVIGEIFANVEIYPNIVFVPVVNYQSSMKLLPPLSQPLSTKLVIPMYLSWPMMSSKIACD